MGFLEMLCFRDAIVDFVVRFSLRSHFLNDHFTFHAEPSASALKTKDKIINLVVQWVALYGLLLMDNPAVVRFLEVMMFDNQEMTYLTSCIYCCNFCACPLYHVFRCILKTEAGKTGEGPCTSKHAEEIHWSKETPIVSNTQTHTHTWKP